MTNTIAIKASRFLITFEDGTKSYITLCEEQIKAASICGYPFIAIVKDILGDKPVKFINNPIVRKIELNLDEAWNALEEMESGELD